ncbi:hypothetical protein Plhal304r1_c013g0050681 [Plasmopara halstedii]
MVLSILRHFTPHFTLPDDMIRRLQYISERYLLTSRSDPSRRFVKLAKANVCHVSFNRGGLQMPRLADTIKKQRVLLLQQLFWMEEHELWKATTTALLACTLPAEFQLSTFDFLSCLFSRLFVVCLVDPAQASIQFPK